MGRQQVGTSSRAPNEGVPRDQRAQRTADSEDASSGSEVRWGGFLRESSECRQLQLKSAEGIKTKDA